MHRSAWSGGLGHRRRLRLNAQSRPLQVAVKDPLAPFAQAVLVIRWGTTAVSLVLASTGLQNGDRGLLAACCALVAYTVLRTLRPLRFDDRLAGDRKCTRLNSSH